MKHILVLIFLCEVLYGVWNIIKTILFFNKKKSNKIEKNLNTDFELIIVIPCLREQLIICNTLNYFLNIIKNYENIKIIVVTTEKEEYEKILGLKDTNYLKRDILNNRNISYLVDKYNVLFGINQIKELIKHKDNIDKWIEKFVNNSLTTSQIVEKFILDNNLDKVIHMHYPKKDGIMADQLNYVLNKYKVIDDKKTYFSVYNADSFPNEKTIEQVFNTIYSQNPKVIQQYSYAFKNLETLSFLMKGFALYQSNFEIKNGLMNSMVFSKFLYTYVVGHGMYIRLDILKKLGGFDNKFWCEDIYLSSVLRNKNIEIFPIYLLENMETPKYLNIQIKQNAVWFKTSNQWIKMLKNIKKKDNKIQLSTCLWFIQRIRMNLSWLLLPLIILFTFVYSIYEKSTYLFAISFCNYIFMQLSIYLTTIFTIEKLENIKLQNKIKIIFSTMLITFISNLGPIYSLINVKMKKFKTVR